VQTLRLLVLFVQFLIFYCKHSIKLFCVMYYLSVVAGEGMLHSLKKLYKFKKLHQISEKFHKTLFFLSTKFFEILGYIYFFLNFHPCSTPLRAAIAIYVLWQGKLVTVYYTLKKYQQQKCLIFFFTEYRII
jgi:hypothetical protein